MAMLAPVRASLVPAGRSSWDGLAIFEPVAVVEQNHTAWRQAADRLFQTRNPCPAVDHDQVEGTFDLIDR